MLFLFLLFFLFLFLISTIPTFIAPLRWTWRVCAFLFLLLTASIAFTVANDLEFVDMLALSFLIIYGTFASLVISIRWIIQKLRKIQVEISAAEAKAIQITDSFLFFIMGGILSIYIYRSMSFSFAGVSHGFIIHSGIMLISLIIGASILCFILYKKRIFHSKILVLLFSLTGGLLLFSTAGIFYPSNVMKEAKSIAEGNAYCIGLNQRGRPVTSLEDLTFLTMDKQGFSHHAFLLIEKADGTLEPYYWSYLQSRFISGVVNWTNENRPVIPCRPEQEFANNIPLIKNSPSQNMEFYFHDRFLKIPEKYSPHISTNSISIAVKAPSFEPVQRKEYTRYASMEIRSRKWIENLHADYDGLKPTGEIGNLIQIKNVRPHIDWYYRYDKDDLLITATACYSKGRLPQTACQHRFYRNGAMYSFDHSIEFLAQSAEREEELFELFESFKDN